MTATRLLVLGLVRELGQAHGYRVSQELMAWEADKWANTKTGSIYHALRQLAKEGHLAARPEDGDNEGPRTDYSITPAGDAEFMDMAARALSDAQPRADMLCAGLVFMSALTRPHVLALLRERVEALKIVREGTDRKGTFPPHIAALLGFQSASTKSQIAWVESEIADIADGAYAFAGEGSSAAAGASKTAQAAIG